MRTQEAIPGMKNSMQGREVGGWVKGCGVQE